MQLKTALLAAALAAAGFAAQSLDTAQAATATANLPVTITIAKACNVAATGVNFGTQTFLSTAIQNTSGSLSVTCTHSTPYTIALDAGASGSLTDRTMAGQTGGNTDKVHYELYTDNTYTKIWGDGTGSTGTVPGTGSGTSQSITVYSQTLAQNAPAPDTYNDTVHVTVTY